jgi:hypothetical protein
MACRPATQTGRKDHKMYTSALAKIHNAYNPDLDTGPTAPIHWSVESLADLVGKLIDRVDILEAAEAQRAAEDQENYNVRLYTPTP